MMRGKIKLFLDIYIGKLSGNFDSFRLDRFFDRCTERQRRVNSYLANSGWYREEMDREKSIAPTPHRASVCSFIVSRLN